MVLRQRIVKPAHLQQQLRVGVVRVGVVGNQFDVLFEGLLGIRIVFLLPVGIAENVVGGGVAGGEFGRLLVVLDGLIEFLLAKIVVGQGELRALVIRVGGHKFFERVFLFGHV